MHQEPLGRTRRACLILTDGVAGICISLPLLSWHRALLVGVGGDQAGIDCQAFTAHQTFAQASLDYRLEQVPQDIALTEAAVAVAREGEWSGTLPSKPSRQNQR